MKPFDLKTFAERMRQKGFKVGFVHQRNLPHAVRCPDLSRFIMGDELLEREHRLRKWWCERECEFDWDATPISDSIGRIVGREFMFVDVDEATIFALRFL